MALMKQHKQRCQQEYYYSALVTSDPEEPKAKNPSWEVMKTRRPCKRKSRSRRSAATGNHNDEKLRAIDNLNYVSYCVFDQLSIRNCEFKNSQKQSDHYKGGNNLHVPTSLVPTSNVSDDDESSQGSNLSFDTNKCA